MEIVSASMIVSSLVRCSGVGLPLLILSVTAENSLSSSFASSVNMMVVLVDGLDTCRTMVGVCSVRSVLAWLPLGVMITTCWSVML